MSTMIDLCRASRALLAMQLDDLLPLHLLYDLSTDELLRRSQLLQNTPGARQIIELVHNEIRERKAHWDLVEALEEHERSRSTLSDAESAKRRLQRHPPSDGSLSSINPSRPEKNTNEQKTKKSRGLANAQREMRIHIAQSRRLMMMNRSSAASTWMNCRRSSRISKAMWDERRSGLVIGRKSSSVGEPARQSPQAGTTPLLRISRNPKRSSKGKLGVKRNNKKQLHSSNNGRKTKQVEGRRDKAIQLIQCKPSDPAPSSSGDDASSLDREEQSLAESQTILRAASSRSRLEVYIDLLPLPPDAAEDPIEPTIASDAVSDSMSNEAEILVETNSGPEELTSASEPVQERQTNADDDGEETNCSDEEQELVVEEFQPEEEEVLRPHQPHDDLESAEEDANNASECVDTMNSNNFRPVECDEKFLINGRELDVPTSLVIDEKIVNENFIGRESEARKARPQPSFGFESGRVRRAREELDQHQLEILSMAERKSAENFRPKTLDRDQSVDQLIPSIDAIVSSRDIREMQLPLLLACIDSLQELMRTSEAKVDFSQRVYVVSEERDELKSILDDVLQKKSWIPLSKRDYRYRHETVPGCWNLLWTWRKPNIDYLKLFVWQKVNHFPNSRVLTRKDYLKRQIQRFTSTGCQRLRREFSLMPETFNLPLEFVPFMDAFTNGALENADENFWIMKPVKSSRGRGIVLLNDIAETHYGQPVVMQKYIPNPLLLNKHKFDLRLFCLVTSFQPLEAFLHQEGFARLCTQPFRLANDTLKEPFVHLTNSSIQKNNLSNSTCAAEPGCYGGSKISLKHLRTLLKEQNVDFDEIWKKIIDLVLKSLVVVEDSIPHQGNSFELFGYDILLDEEQRPWLLEVNSSPSMDRGTALDHRTKSRIIQDTIELVDPKPFDRLELATLLRSRAELNRDRLLGSAFPRKLGRPPESFGAYEQIAPSNMSRRVHKLKRIAQKTTKKKETQPHNRWLW